MVVLYSDYFEIPAPLLTVSRVLNNPENWCIHPLNIKRIGDKWQWKKRWYRISFETKSNGIPNEQFLNEQPLSGDPRPHVFRWIMTSNQGSQTIIELTLYDAVIATHGALCIAVSQQQRLLPHILAIYKVGLLVRACQTALCTLVEKTQPSQVVHAAMESLLPQHSFDPAPTEPLGEAPLTSPLQMDKEETSSLVAMLRVCYPRTVEQFEAMGAIDHLERVWLLEQGWQQVMRGKFDTTNYVRGLSFRHQNWVTKNGHHGHRDGHENISNLATYAPYRGFQRMLNGHGWDQQSIDYDLIYAGGGLGLLHAAVMAHCYGWRVMIFDRGEIGCAHREWNISRGELQTLVDMGLVTWDELKPVIMREYYTGLVSFYSSPHSRVPHNELWMPEVLSLAIDANGLLRLMRRKVEQCGGTILDYHAFHRVYVSEHNPLRVEVELETVPRNGKLNYAHTEQAELPEHKTQLYRARLLLDGMGSTSPLALLRQAGRPFAGVCPTVGTTVEGFVQGSGPREYDPTVGDILISVADTQHKRQLIWEGFPGRDHEMAVYVFYYVALNGTTKAKTPHATSSQAQQHYSLFELFEQYFTLLPTYKKPGPHFRNLKPLYGYIPGRHSLRANEAPLLRGVLPIGDSAAQQSPLTYCGFGSHVRNLHRTTSLLDYAMRCDMLEPHHLKHVNAFQTNVSLNWVFSRFMQPWGHPHNVNELQNVFLGTLNNLGTSLATRFFQDRMRWNDYNQILGTVLMRYPIIMLQAWSVLKPAGIYRWISDYVRFTLEAIWSSLARIAGPSFERRLYRLSDTISPKLSLALRARYAEWRAMRWIEP